MTSDSTTSPARSGGVATSPRWVTAVLWALQIVVAAGFLFSAYAMLTGAPPVMATFEALGAPWLATVLGVLEALGAVALLVPRLVGLAATAFVALTVGAVLTHLVVGGDATMALGLLVLSAVIAALRRKETVALLRSVVA